MTTKERVHRFYAVQLDGVPVGRYETLEAALKGVNVEIHFGINPLRLNVVQIAERERE